MLKRSERRKILMTLCINLLRIKFSSSANKPGQSKKLLFDSFKHLGGVYVKFLQLLALNLDFMVDWAGPAEFEVFESVEFEHINIYAILTNELPDYQTHFQYVETEPFAAGSFAQ